jgi:hypothetical protein
MFINSKFLKNLYRFVNCKPQKSNQHDKKQIKTLSNANIGIILRKFFSRAKHLF